MTWAHLVVGGVIYLGAMTALHYLLLTGSDRRQSRSDGDS